MNKTKYNVRTVTPAARDLIENNAKTQTCAELCSRTEISAVRNVLSSVRAAISHFCPHKEYCYKPKYITCDDCEYLRERMRFIKEDGNLTLNNNFQI